METKNLSLSGQDKLGVIGNLNTMLSAGIPLFEAVESLLEDATGNPQKFLLALREDLTAGNHVYKTMAKFPKTFDKVTVSVIKASEEAGTLETALADLAKNIKKEMEFSGKIISAMIYPMLIVTVFFGVLFLILIVVVPKISQVFSRLNIELPLPTRVLIFMSDTLTKNPLPVLGGIALAIGLLVYLFKNHANLILPVIFRLPIVSKLIKEIDLTRFSRNLYLLLTAGIPIGTALELSKEVVIRKQTRNLIENCRQMVITGKKFSEGLSGGKKEIPSIVVKLIDVGEKSGSLPKALFDISEFLDYQVTETLKTLTVLLEPIMLVLVGISVGAMMLAIIAPIYGLIGQVGSVR